MKNLIALLALIAASVLMVPRVEAAYITATATAQISGGFVVGFTVTDGGSGYTNAPVVQIVGGGGDGATATAVISSRAVTSITVVDNGSNYSTAPEVIIAPPVLPLPHIVVSPASDLYFTGLEINYGEMGEYGGAFFLVKNISGVWSNQTPPYEYLTSDDGTYSTIVDGVATTNLYGLEYFPISEQATATAVVVNGYVTGITITDNGGGYLSDPTVQIVGGGGSGALATASNGAQEGQLPYQVSSITVAAPGSGYTSAPTVVIGPPTATPQFAAPPQIIPMVRLDMGNIVSNLTYQLQGSPNLVTWTNVGASFVASTPTNTTYLYATNSSGFFRLEYIP